MMRQASILVVDDDEDIRRIVTRTLENMGYAVLDVGSGDEAALAMASQRFRLAVVDLKMRDLGGQKAVMEMHRHDPQMRIIVVFGSPDTPIGELRATAQGWLYKPFRPEELRLTVERVLGGASQEEP
ncbi:MAG: response regulator [Anaerolineae bacterium]